MKIKKCHKIIPELSRLCKFFLIFLNFKLKPYFLYLCFENAKNKLPRPQGGVIHSTSNIFLVPELVVNRGNLLFS